MPCSAVTLSLATVAAVVALVLLAVAFATDNWVQIEVNRAKIQEELRDDSSSVPSPSDLQSSPLYFSRTKGLWRVCFPQEKPDQTLVRLYLSPVETFCMNIDYYLPDEDSVTASFTPEQTQRLHIGRSAIGLFIVAFAFVFVAFWTGVAGCWKRSSGNITATAILMLLACLFSAGGMGLWHWGEYLETEKLSGDEYYKDWPKPLQRWSTLQFSWSFYLCWTSVFLQLLSSVLFAGSTTCLRQEQQHHLAANSSQYLMTVYPHHHHQQQAQQQKGAYAYGYYPGYYATAAPPAQQQYGQY